MDLIQTLTSLLCFWPDFGNNNDWLLEQCHRIGLAVGVNGSRKRLILTWLKHSKIFANDPPSADRRILQNIQMIVHIFSGWICFNYGTNVSVLQRWIPLQVVDCKHGVFWFANKQVQITKLSILKLVSLESLAGNDFSEWGTQAKAQRNRNLNCQLWRKVGSRCFIEGLYQALFLFHLACRNVIHKVKWK